MPIQNKKWEKCNCKGFLNKQNLKGNFQKRAEMYFFTIKKHATPWQYHSISFIYIIETLKNQSYGCFMVSFINEVSNFQCKIFNCNVTPSPLRHIYLQQILQETKHKNIVTTEYKQGYFLCGRDFYVHQLWRFHFMTVKQGS